ncbi:G-type lectin S-receptor-like serine/threonine-protein kinase [Thalictrum thalictroides]|uniref:G-type lectin S-receptor-like serine/threonine-protein kinase n=1 Tax=Thalictrum thalictroides TaxID=46969 RepID=A0A7J6UYL2_THATH|nr:G-type lectin S-receptor-like serine/threonine-protein kinase [Thalictrum thalictroides]
MKNPRTHLLYLLLSFVISIPLVVGESSVSKFNITIGSSISTSPNGTNYWLSPSGVYAFGFYPLCSGCDRYGVGIWLTKSYDSTLVWTPNLDNDEPISNASIVVDQYGVFVLRRSGSTLKPLFGNLFEPALYAMMKDSGNFVVYNSVSDIIWQSFDHPTDTIVSGQTLKSGHSLISKSLKYRLMMRKSGELIICSKFYNRWWKWICNWVSHTRKRSSPVALNLDSNGRLYLADWDGLVIKNFTEGEEQQHAWSIVGKQIYRVTLEDDGVLRMYSERIGCDCGRSVVLWESYCSTCKERDHVTSDFFLAFGISFGIIIVIAICCICIIELAGKCKRRQNELK